MEINSLLLSVLSLTLPPTPTPFGLFVHQIAYKPN